MAEFVQMMKDWRRMCKDRRCDSCNLKGSCNIDPDSRTDDDIRKIDTKVKIWAAEHPEPVYPTWGEYLASMGVMKPAQPDKAYEVWFRQLYSTNIPADIAQKIGIEPKEG